MFYMISFNNEISEKLHSAYKSFFDRLVSNKFRDLNPST